MPTFPDYEVIDVQPRSVKCPRCQTEGMNGRCEEYPHCTFHCPTCEMEFSYCAKCQKPWTAPMSPLCRDNHESTLPYYVFTPYFDYGLWREITSYADRWRAMRQTGLQYRDLPSKGELSARRDRIEQSKREQARSYPASLGARPSEVRRLLGG